MLQLVSKISICLYVVLLLIAVPACKSKKKSEISGTPILAFEVKNDLKVDPSIAAMTIQLPAAQQNNYWYGGNSLQDQSIENIAKEYKFKKGNQVTLKKVADIWSGYRSGNENRYVFAPIIKGDEIITLDASALLSSYDIVKKKRIWEVRIFPRQWLKNYQNPKISYHDGIIFASAGTNKIAAFDEKKQEIIWSKDLSSIPNSYPISDGKSVYFTTDDDKLYALDVQSGRIKWIHSAVLRTTAILGSASPIFYNNLVIASFASGELYALNKETSEVVWTMDLNTRNHLNSDFYLNDIDATPVIKNGVIYAIGNGGLMTALNAKNGQLLWKKELSSIIDFWVSGDFIYLINNDNKILAIYKKNGAIKWISDLPNLRKKDKLESKIIYNGVAMVQDKLVTVDNKGLLLFISPLDGKIESKIQLTGFQQLSHAPIAIGNRFYFHGLGRYSTSIVVME